MSNLPSGAVPMPRQEPEPTFCGYRNHETFTVSMRLNNTSADYSAQVRALVADATGTSREAWRSGKIPMDEVGAHILATLADMLRERIEAECAPVPAGALPELGRDMLTLALASVDWCELAQEWLDDAAENASARVREATP